MQTNLESQRRQYDLVEEARRRSFSQIEVIDDDLGRFASGMVARPGFDRLVAWLCAGEVGAVLCFDASRLARNGRDWHHLLELCGLVEARVIDLDGVYDPCRPNDRLLLGMKGSISEFELGVLRARTFDAARAKAQRGKLRISVPFGYVWHRETGLGFDPDMRLQEVIRLIFARFRKLGSATSRAFARAWSTSLGWSSGYGALARCVIAVLPRTRRGPLRRWRWPTSIWGATDSWNRCVHDSGTRGKRPRKQAPSAANRLGNRLICKKLRRYQIASSF